MRRSGFQLLSFVKKSPSAEQTADFKTVSEGLGPPILGRDTPCAVEHTVVRYADKPALQTLKLLANFPVATAAS